ncbi:histidine kinase dimerization/phosphoacceptor domain -containing protein [Marimonas sp. MJW-29]|uniref:Histidine kinase dimerization/phosphoacceptor domain -containing protein n=1 Tax=Sulfitobacter sediminis TaxID=3234186 RepID=A0ABV3RNY1_9RHOB
MRADLHPMNAERLRTLQDYDILDTEAEDDFNEIVELASQICGTPISLISLLDEDRQWFKAKVGFDKPETSLEESICSHAILNGDLFEISDLKADPRTADNPLTMGDDGVRFYAGAPLIAANGLPMGTLCVLDRKPLELTDMQRTALKVLSRQVMKQLELRVALRNQAILQSEADHRVKNSLQSMSAIVRVYTRTITDPTALEALGAIQRRIDAMAELHLELQGSDGRDTIDTGTYRERVMHLLQETAPENISFRTEFADIVMRSDQAANLAMIISEFVANSIKHAFPDGMPGEISVALTVSKPGTYRLECTDNGIGGESEGTPTGRNDGIGLSLVNAAVSSLGGNSDASLTGDGSRLVIDFGDARQTGNQSEGTARRNEG